MCCFTIKNDEKKMKKFLNISLLALVAISSLMLGSCKNEVDEIFDEDAVARLEKAKADYIDILTSNGGKWQMEYYANSEEPGYIYLMTFKKDGSVTISGKNQWIGLIQGQNFGTLGYGSETSLWDVITDNGPVLSLNSYNKFFHVFAEPEDIPSTDTEATDETGYGHEGDYEFDLMKYSNDTLYITGKKYGIDMIMTRVAGDVDDEVYINEVVAMADSFFNAKIPQVYINLPNGVRWIVKDGATSILKMFREGADEISTAEYHNVIITHDGLSFMTPISLDGYTVQNFIRQADGSLLCRDDEQTTITADDLSVVFGYKSLTWRLNSGQFGGAYADYITQLGEELKTYNKSTFVYAQVNYDMTKETYVLTFFVKKGANTFKPTFMMTETAVDANHIKFNITEADNTAAVYAQRCPAMQALVDAIGSTTYVITTPSLLAPVNMTLTDSSNSANYINVTL